MEIKQVKTFQQVCDERDGLKLENALLKGDLDRAEKRLNEADLTILDLVNQSVGDYDKDSQAYTYDSMCMSTYEHALVYLIEKNLIKREQVRR